MILRSSSASLYLHVSRIPLWIVLFITLFMMRLSINVAYVMIAIFINNSVPKRQAGAINGLAVSLAAVTRQRHNIIDRILPS